MQDYVYFKMSEEDLLLREEMGRLEIQSLKLIERSNDNPFDIKTKKSLYERPHNQNSSCTCSYQKKNRNTGIIKKKSNQILKQPVLQVIKSCVNHKTVGKECQSECCTENLNVDSHNLYTLVKTCNQLKISSDTKEQSAALVSVSNVNKWWKNVGASQSRESRELAQHSQPGTCSQQALNPPCDVTIDELASYFETLVHIPKKMSSMAEMMYI